MTLDDKITRANSLIDGVLKEYRRPAIMCSFGKDSMVVLDLVRKRAGNLPVIFHREPYQPRKYAFATKVIADMGLTVHDWPHASTAICMGNGEVEIIKNYTIGNGTAYVPVGTRAEGGDDMVCGLRDIYYAPTGQFAYPWDVVFHGHKSADIDPILGPVPLKTDLLRNNGSASAAFVIREFTDDDVWEYAERFGLPIHHERYEKVNGKWRERVDKTHNPDYMNACTACMVRGGGPVPCPKLGGNTVINIAHTLAWTDGSGHDYIGN